MAWRTQILTGGSDPSTGNLKLFFFRHEGRGEAAERPDGKVAGDSSEEERNRRRPIESRHCDLPLEEGMYSARGSEFPNPILKMRKMEKNWSIIMANVDGLITKKYPFKKDMIREVATLANALAVGLTETHLNSAYREAEMHMPGYEMYRADRADGRKKGGTALYLKEELSTSTKVLLSYSNGFVEVLAVMVKELRLAMAIVYRPPRCPTQYFEEVMERLRTTLASCDRPAPEIVILGDFNLPHVDWDSRMVNGGRSDERFQAELIFSLMDEHCLNQEVEEPTRRQNKLDLVFSNNSELVQSISVQTSVITDHNIVIINTNIRTGKHNDAEIRRGTSDFGFGGLHFWSDSVEWNDLRKALSDVDWESTKIWATQDVDEALEEFMREVLKVAKKHVPPKWMSRREKTKIPRDRRALMRKRLKVQRRMEKCSHARNMEMMKEKMQRIEMKLKESHRLERSHNEKKAVEAIGKNSKYFYKYAKRHSSIKAKVGPMLDASGNPVTEARDMAEVLRIQYEGVFSSLREQLADVHNEQDDSPALRRISFTPEDLTNSTRTIRSNSASGPDNVPAILLKNCAAELSRPLSRMWKLSLEKCKIPDGLKKAIITPIYKGGERSSASSYRPVALTSHIIKVFEKIVVGRLVEYFDGHELWNDHQHGFRKGRSCLSQLLNHYDRVLSAMEDGADMDVIYLDFEKAFDKVDYGILCRKLTSLGVTGEIGNWIAEFLTNRTQRVIVDGEMSVESVVGSGVPQGSVLGPVLFLCMMSDIDRGMDGATVSSFADDTRVSRQIQSGEEREALQGNLRRIYTWAEENNMSFNNAKFEVLHHRTGTLTTHQYYNCEGRPLEVKRETKDLGVMISSTLDFQPHINKIVKDARSKAGWIFRVFETRETTPMITLYKSLVLPILEYCSQLWTPGRPANVLAIEAVQRTYTSKIEAIKHLNYWERLEALNLYSLERRRERYVIIYL